jgi:general secretion pathway protein G
VNGERTTSAPLRRLAAGFTLLELTVVMALLGLLLSLALPRYLDAMDRGREQVMAHDLAQMRQALDHYYGDRGMYPDRLEELVERRYLRALPPNPFTQRVDWEVVSPPNGAKGAVYDVIEPAGQRAQREKAAQERAAIAASPGAQPASGATAPQPAQP